MPHARYHHTNGGGRQALTGTIETKWKEKWLSSFVYEKLLILILRSFAAATLLLVCDPHHETTAFMSNFPALWLPLIHHYPLVLLLRSFAPLPRIMSSTAVVPVWCSFNIHYFLPLLSLSLFIFHSRDYYDDGNIGGKVGQNLTNLLYQFSLLCGSSSSLFCSDPGM